MIPIELLQIVEPGNLQKGAFIQRFEYSSAPAIIGTFQGATVAVHFSDPMYCGGVMGAGGAAVVIADYRVRVDPASIELLNSVQQRQGALMVRNGQLLICAPGDRPYGYIPVEIGEFAGAPDRGPYCFTRWSLTVDAGDETITLIERSPEGITIPSGD